MRLDDRERHRPGAELLQSLGRRDLFSEGDGPAKPDNQFNRQTIGLPAFHDPTPYWERFEPAYTRAPFSYASVHRPDFLKKQVRHRSKIVQGRR
jgi:hypothetical protein